MTIPFQNSLLASLAILARQRPSILQQVINEQTITIIQNLPGAPSQTVEFFHRYNRHVWLDPNAGDDTLRPDRGSHERPWRTWQALASFIGKPGSVADFVSPWYIHVIGNGPAGGVVQLPQSRRIVIIAEGGARIPGLEQDVDNADRFGSVIPFGVTLIGSGGSAYAGVYDLASRAPMGLIHTFVDTALGIPVLSFNKLGAGATPFLLVTDNCFIDGGDVEWNGFGVLEPLFYLNNTIIHLAGGAWGSPVAALERGILLEANNLYLINAADEFHFDNVAGWNGGLCAADIHVTGAPDPSLQTGIKNVNVLAASSWNGPNSSCHLDEVTNYFVKTNGATWAAADKVIIEDPAA